MISRLRRAENRGSEAGRRLPGLATTGIEPRLEGLGMVQKG